MLSYTSVFSFTHEDPADAASVADACITREVSATCVTVRGATVHTSIESFGGELLVSVTSCWSKDADVVVVIAGCPEPAHIRVNRVLVVTLKEALLACGVPEGLARSVQVADALQLHADHGRTDSRRVSVS